ncbi:MAG TPA: FAD-binding and (Fe-S)-binding domain-containing protein [Anaeromyxobacteraceae bacterium]|jgi:D-lactate dehydrogenase|nr:FAD-binding and (Fe-S)-binding domain-containing protein [Anaeromyxobacteraceae bacterium]
MDTGRDRAALPPAYRELHQELARSLPAERLICDPLRTFAFGTDASFYRLVPRLVVQVRSAEEVALVLRAASRLGLGCTFRAAGTSLSGQAVSDSVLVLLAGGFRQARVQDAGRRIVLEPGVIGAEANALLAAHGRKLGPDPASIGAAMVGGIAANNASGMCCGTAQNSYRTIESVKVVLADGARLDSADSASRAAFAQRHGELLEGLVRIRDEIRADPALADRIREKYRIKNTTGYSLNAFVDFDDPFEILTHLLVGSEGTLAFLAELTYRTVEDHPHKASALVLFPDLDHAARATQRLAAAAAVSAAELMDRPSLRAVEGRPGLPAILKTLPADACALLVEARGASPAALAQRIAAASDLLAGIATLAPVRFTAVKAEYEVLWDVRRGLFPAVGASRRIGTTVVIEDVAVPIAHLAPATAALQRLFREHGYDEGIIFGHALDGNVHFVFTQDFATPSEVARYRRFMEAVCEMVVSLDGSLKAEHGTGRNMAPFVEREWGARAYGIMKRVKALFDPRGILNPGVILNGDPDAFVKDLKALPRAHELVDRCIECGFCEPKCASRSLTLSPRQRIAVQREIARLRASHEDPARLERLEDDYRYQGLDTCAADGLCATACPVSIDTGKLTKVLRAASQGPLARQVAGAVSGHYAGALAAARAGLALADAAHAGLGERALAGLSRGLHRVSGRLLPVWNAALPRPARTGPLEDVTRGRGRRVVYFPACVTRLWGPSRGAADERADTAAVLSILEKAGYDVLFPRDLGSLCCGLTFESKGFPELADQKCAELERALLERSEGGAIPVLCDTSPCTQRMRAHFSAPLRVYEPAEFIHTFLMDQLRFERRAGAVALHVTCSAQKMGLAPQLRAVAEACAERVVIPPTGCCGFAGDRGLSVPELNAAALAGLREAVQGCEAGYSNSRGCEVGLSLHGGIPYQSIVHLVDRCTAAPAGENLT